MQATALRKNLGVILKRNQEAVSRQRQAAGRAGQKAAAAPLSVAPQWVAGVNPFTSLKASDRNKVKSSKRGGCRRCRRRRLLDEGADWSSPLFETSRSATALKHQKQPGPARSLRATTDEGFVDWSLALPSIKDQGLCASGWAFATTALAEAAHYMNTGEIASLSEAELLDCTYNATTGNWGW